jgi:hypothetical protein
MMNQGGGKPQLVAKVVCSRNKCIYNYNERKRLARRLRNEPFH